MSFSVACHACGQRIGIPDEFARRKIRCSCGVYCEVPSLDARPQQEKASEEPALIEEAVEPRRPEPSRRKRRPAQEPPKRPEPMPEPPPEVVEDLDDGSPYLLADRHLKRCPSCSKDLPKETAVCPQCEFDFRTGKKPPKVFTAVSRTWEAGWPMTRRRSTFFLCLCVAGGMSIVAALFTGHWSSSITSLVFGIALLAFVLGTFDRLDFSRDTTGKVKLTRTWYALFWERPKERIRLGEHESVVTSVVAKNGADYAVLFTLFLMGIIPGVLWFYFVFLETTYQVALTKDHGYPATILYRGISQAHAEDIASTLSEYAALPRDT
jgi:hypothetical protein